MKLNRIQLSLHKGWRKRTCAIVVARSSKWSNPHAIGKTMVHIDGHRGLVRDREHAVSLYCEWLTGIWPPNGVCEI
jgi:hypothetical protein